MHVKKFQGFTQAQSLERAKTLAPAHHNQRKLALAVCGLFLLAGSVIYAQHAVAASESTTDVTSTEISNDEATNVSGVVIEVITDPTDSTLASEPVQDYLGDTGANDSPQTDLWTRIKDGYAIPNATSSYTTRQENWYASNPDYLKRMLGRSQKYLFHIVEEVQKRDMPSEIALLPMIESAFNPQAYSRSRASGIWQFIPSTGKHFGLQQNWWVDNRRDVTAATNAALDYLQKLHGMFGSWDLALAAYNAGEGTVQRAINRNRDAGLPTDYQSLNLPLETRNYVPKLQAIKNVISDPQKFGLNVDSIPNRPYFARVTSPKQIDSKLAAELAEISYDEFAALNPSYNRPVITSQGEKHQLLLPVWAAERFAQNLANYDKPLSNWQTYNAKRGESMDNIAQKFGMDVSQLRQANGLKSGNKLLADRTMLVALANNGQQISTDTNSYLIDEADMQSDHANKEVVEKIEPKREEAKVERAKIEHIKVAPVIHKVKRGDTLMALAAKYDTDTKALMKLNHLKSSQLKAGQRIQLTEASVKTVEKRSEISHTKLSKNDKAGKEKSSNKKTVAEREDVKSKKNMASRNDKSKNDKRSLISELMNKKSSSRRTSVRSNVRVK